MPCGRQCNYDIIGASCAAAARNWGVAAHQIRCHQPPRQGMQQRSAVRACTMPPHADGVRCAPGPAPCARPIPIHPPTRPNNAPPTHPPLPAAAVQHPPPADAAQVLGKAVGGQGGAGAVRQGAREQVSRHLDGVEAVDRAVVQARAGGARADQQLRQGRRVHQRLQHAVHEAGVAQVLQPRALHSRQPASQPASQPDGQGKRMPQGVDKSAAPREGEAGRGSQLPAAALSRPAVGPPPLLRPHKSLQRAKHLSCSWQAVAYPTAARPAAAHRLADLPPLQ